MKHVLALDLATKTGFAYGKAGSIPTHGSVRLKDPDDNMVVAAGAIARWLRDYCRQHGKPDLLAVEQWMQPQASRSAQASEFQILLHGAVHGVAGCLGLSTVSPRVGAVRKLICGRASDTSRPNGSKLMMLDRLKAIGVIPQDLKNTDESDAVGLFLYVGEQYCEVSPKSLVLFG